MGLRWLLFKPRPLGAQGERIAARFLRRQGYRITGRNVHTGRYEIDIVAEEGDTLVFVEVKTRRSAEFAAPEANITYQKRQHLRRAAKYYLATHDLHDRYCRFDVVTVVVPQSGRPQVTLYRNAFPDA